MGESSSDSAKPAGTAELAPLLPERGEEGRGSLVWAACKPLGRLCFALHTELPLPPLHDDAAPGCDLPVLRPVQGTGSVLQPQGPSGAELDRLPQKSSSDRCVLVGWALGRSRLEEGCLASCGPRTKGSLTASLLCGFRTPHLPVPWRTPRKSLLQPWPCASLTLAPIH